MARFFRNTLLKSLVVFLVSLGIIHPQESARPEEQDIILRIANSMLDEYEPRAVPIELEVFNLKDQKNLTKTSVYNTITTHSDQLFNSKWGRPTNAHETIHEINNSISQTKRGYRAFYGSLNKAIWIKEPKITMDDIIPYIPQSVRGYRFPTYFIDQKRFWNEVALYPLDEWVAYIGGAECAVDDYKNHNLDPTKYPSEEMKFYTDVRSDEVSGSLEFAIYCTGLAMCIKDKDREYWNDYMQFRYAMKFFLVKAEEVFFTGKGIFPSRRQDELLENLQNHQDTTEMRTFLLNEFDGLFIR